MFRKTQNSACPTHTQIHYLCLVQFSITMSSEKAWSNSLFIYIWTNVVSCFKIGHQEFPAQLNPFSYVCMHYYCHFMFSMSNHTVSRRHHACHYWNIAHTVCSTSASRFTGPVTVVQLPSHHSIQRKPLHSPILLHQFHSQIPATVTADLPSICHHTSVNIIKVTATNVTPTSKICVSVMLLLLTAVR